MNSISEKFSTLNAISERGAYASQTLAHAKESTELAKDTFTSAMSEQLDDATLLARHIVGQYGKPETVTVLKGTVDDDDIHIGAGENGGIKVTINGETTSYTAEQVAKLVIDGGDGNDTITVDKEVTTKLYLTGGKGDDAILSGSGNDLIIDNYGSNYIDGGDGNDTIKAGGFDRSGSTGNHIEGGNGNDYLEGGRANDIIEGGSGNNVIYGLDGDDFITAGSGRNYIDGGRGNDTINNEGAQAMLFGGRGDDAIYSHGHASVIVDMYGNNEINALRGADRLFASSVSSVNTDSSSAVQQITPSATPTFLHVEGSEGFKSRVDSDLDTLSQISIGQRMMSGIAETGYSVTIQENFNSGNQCQSGKDGRMRPDGTPGPGISSKIRYNPAEMKLNRNGVDWAEHPPLTSLFHEFAHSYNASHGNMANGAYRYDGTKAEDNIGLAGSEFQAVGIEHPLIQSNPEGLNENGMRKFLGIEQRTTY